MKKHEHYVKLLLRDDLTKRAKQVIAHPLSGLSYWHSTCDILGEDAMIYRVVQCTSKVEFARTQWSLNVRTSQCGRYVLCSKLTLEHNIYFASNLGLQRESLKRCTTSRPTRLPMLVVACCYRSAGGLLVSQTSLADRVWQTQVKLFLTTALYSTLLQGYVKTQMEKTFTLRPQLHPWA